MEHNFKMGTLIFTVPRSKLNLLIGAVFMLFSINSALFAGTKPLYQETISGTVIDNQGLCIVLK